MSIRPLELRTVGPVAVLTIALAACSSGSAPTAAPTTRASAAAPSASASPLESPPESAQPSSSLAVLPKGPSGPGTYATLFEPGLTLRLDRPAENDADTPTSWIDLVFEGDAQFEIGFVRVDNRFDPTHPGKLIDLPPDLAAWVAKLPGLTLIAPAKTVRVGGLDATQLDFRTTRNRLRILPIPGIDYSLLGFGDIPYIGFDQRGAVFRLIVVPVGGHQVAIQMISGNDWSGIHFDATVKALQPVVDSIIWR